MRFKTWMSLLLGTLALNALAVSGSPIFVLNSLDATVSIVDPKTWTEKQRLPTGKEPHHLYLAPDEKTLIVANALNNSLTFVDPKTGAVTRTLNDIVDPYHLRFSPDMKWFVTTANRLNHVDVYRWNGAQAREPLTLVKRIPAGKTPSHLWIDNASRVAYVSLQDSDQVLALDLATQSIRWTINVGKTPADLYLTPDEKHLLVGLTGNNAVEAWALQGNKPPLLSKRLVTGEGAHSFRPLGDGLHVLVSNRAANSISKIALKDLSVVDTLPAPGGPDDMDVLSDGRTLLVTSRWSRKLTVIDLRERRVIRQIPVGRSPHGVWTLDHVSRR
jgi:YVTN family beta-propeller protein